MFDGLPQTPIQQRWRQQTRPLPVVAAIICRQVTGQSTTEMHDSYLLIQRTQDPYRHRWALVGGKWEFGETLVRAVLREVMEETGLDATFVALRGLVSERVAPIDSQDGEAAHFIIFVCHVEAPAGAAYGGKEGVVAWFSAQEIRELHESGAIIPSDYEMLQRFSGSEALPFNEVQMFAGNSEGAPAESVKLIRFEQFQ